jgi:hypothetical protein
MQIVWSVLARKILPQTKHNKASELLALLFFARAFFA